MRVFRASGKTVTEYFSQEKRQLPGECVVFSFTSQEWQQLDHEEIEWLHVNATATEFDEKEEVFRHYFVLTYNQQHWMMFRDVTNCQIDVPVAQALFSMIRRVPFEIRGKVAFDLVSFLFIDISMSLQRGKNWQFRPEQEFRVKGIPERWCVGIKVPNQLKGLLIGPQGKTISRVEKYTEYTENRISLSDQ